MKKIISLTIVFIILSCQTDKQIIKNEENPQTKTTIDSQQNVEDHLTKNDNRDSTNVEDTSTESETDNNKKKDIEKDISSIKHLTYDYFNGDYSYAIYKINQFQGYYKNLDEIQTSLLQYIKGLCLIKCGKYSSGIKELELSKTNLPIKLEKELYNNIGVAYFYLGNMQKAEEYFIKSMSIDFNEEAYNNFLIVNNDPKLANTTILPLSGDNSIYYAQGWLCYYLGDYVSAISHFKKMIETVPDYIMGYMSIGMVYDTIFNYKTALEYYKKALEIDETYPDLWNNIGIVYYQLNKYNEAENAFYKAIELNTHYPYPYNNLGFFYLEKNDIIRAEIKFVESININNTDVFLLGESYAGLAIIYSLKGDPEKSILFKQKSWEYNYNLRNMEYIKNDLRWKNDYIILYSKIPEEY